MYCKHCGKLITDDSTYCQYCGKGIDKSSFRKVLNDRNVYCSNNYSEDKKKLDCFKIQHKATIKRIGIWTSICIFISILGYLESKSFNIFTLLGWIIVISLLIAVYSNWDEINYYWNKKHPQKANNKRKDEKIWLTGANVYGQKYCAFTGEIIEGEYILVKHKHVVDERTSTRKFGMINQHQIHTSTTTFYWEAFYVDANTYKKYTRSFGYHFSFFFPAIIGLSIPIFFVAVGMGYETFDYKFLLFGSIAGGFVYYVLHKLCLLFVKPTLKEIGLVDSTNIIDSYLEERYPKIMKMINWVESEGNDNKKANDLRFSKLPEF